MDEARDRPLGLDRVARFQLRGDLLQVVLLAPEVDEPFAQPGDVRQTYADIRRAEAELGYAPTTPFAEGIARYVAWYRSSGPW